MLLFFLGSSTTFANCVVISEAPKLPVEKRAGDREGKDICQARKRSTKTKFWVWISSIGVGVFQVNGWRSKSSTCLSDPTESKLFGRISRKLCRDIPGVSDKF